MKIWRLFLMALAMLTFRVAVAQEPKYVYLEIDDIFANAAVRQIGDKVSNRDKIAARKFGSNVEMRLSTSRQVEREAASLLIDFQNTSVPMAFINRFPGYRVTADRKLLRADLFITEYILALLAKASPNILYDSVYVKDSIDQALRDRRIQTALLEYIVKELDDSLNPEAHLLALLSPLPIELGDQKQVRISEALRANNRTALLNLNLPPPICIILRCCRAN